MYATKTLIHQPLRLGLTIGGVALCVVLMLFLLSVYRGVADGSVEYICRNKVDLWVLQRNATNILRGSSILSTAHGSIIREVHGVKTASPVLFLLSGIRKDSQVGTLFLTGYDLTTGLGGPPQLVEGHSLEREDEIVLDKSFAAKFDYKVGDRVRIQDDTLQVVGLSAGTNAFVIQYAFVSIHRAQKLIGFPTLVTCYLVKLVDSAELGRVSAAIHEDLPGVEVYDHETFLHNNIREMESGFLPLLYTVASIGAIVLTTILSLLLSINILERRKDFAVMKAIGSPSRFLPRLVVEQALLLSSAGSVVALLLFFPMVTLIERLSPEVSTKSSAEQIAVVLVIVAAMSLISSFISVQRLRRIYPLEAFA
jgi:putative ABC transport system permease protein